MCLRFLKYICNLVNVQLRPPGHAQSHISTVTFKMLSSSVIPKGLPPVTTLSGITPFTLYLWYPLISIVL